MKTEIVALKGKVYSKSFTLENGQKLILGRGQEADIQILDAGLSRNHCSVEKQDDTFFIADLGSRNGTHVNGERIERAELHAGDVIGLGGIEFQFRCLPERRQRQADFVAAVPEKFGHDLKERLDLDNSGLMELPSQFQSVENYRRVQRDLAAIYRVGNMISAESDLNVLYERVLDAIFQVVRPHRAFILLAHPGTGALQTVATREDSSAIEEFQKAGFSTTVVNECFRDKASLLRANAMTDEELGQVESVIFQNIHSVICVPIETPKKVVGVIYADNVGASESFVRHDLELLTAVGKQAGVAIERALFADQLRKLLYGSVGALVATIEAKDEYTRGHSDRVTSYATQVGKAMGLNADELSTLELAGLLHDVGKIGVPEHILRKPGPLTAEEYAIVKQHPKLGYNIISNIDGAEEIADVVLHHHERWDGVGYPEQLSAEDIPLLARILTLADAFDAMNSVRPYRRALPTETIMNEISQGAGGQFDAAIVAVFRMEYEAGRIGSDDTVPMEGGTDTSPAATT